MTHDAAAVSVGNPACHFKIGNLDLINLCKCAHSLTLDNYRQRMVHREYDLRLDGCAVR